MSVLVAVTALSAAAAWASSAGQPTSGFVSVGGHRMYYECSGQGGPTVVLDAGSPDTSATWRWVQPQIAQGTRVCAYDRAGLGRSSAAARGRRTPQTQVHELRVLLDEAKIPGPYVVVGHSWGGLLARLFAYVYPHQTVGAVLVDATTFPYLTPATARRLRRKTTREGIDIAALSPSRPTSRVSGTSRSLSSDRTSLPSTRSSCRHRTPRRRSPPTAWTPLRDTARTTSSVLRRRVSHNWSSPRSRPS